MYKVILYILFSAISTGWVMAESVKGIVIGTKKEPLIGVNVRWKDTSNETSTDVNGAFSISPQQNSNELEVTYVGYISKTVTVDSSSFLTIQLEESIQLEEVVISQRALGTISSRTTVLQTQRLTSSEFARAACCNLSESFETNPSVDVSYSDAVTGAKQIKLLGLSGTYVQMLTENFPNFRGLAAPYGLDYIPGPWMESVQISKGTSSVKNGYESITGQVNVEYKKPPTSDIVSANLFAADNGQYEANADGSILLNSNLSTSLLAHYSSEEKAFDMNDDGFLDSPLKNQFNIMNRWHYRNEKVISQSGLKFLNERRKGGQTDDALPIFSSVPLYRTNMEVYRGEFFTKNGLILNPLKNESAAMIFSGSYQDQKLIFGSRPYDADEFNVYASLMYEKDFAQAHKLSTGLSLNYDYFDQNYNLSLYNPGEIQDKFAETTTGVYAEYTFNKNNKFILLAGLRADYSSKYNFFITPRVHAKFNFTDWVHLRASAGKGYRTAHVLPENSFFLASSRVFNIADKLDQEEAWNYGLNLSFYVPIAGKELIINGEWYYTDFMKQVVADMDTDPHSVSFYNLDGKSYSSSFQIEATYPFFRGFSLTAAYRIIDAKTTYNGVLIKKPLSGDYKGLVTASYQTPLRKWQFDFTSQFNGGGRMPQPDKTVPLWSTGFGSYVILNAQISKFFRTWSIYAGAENILDFMQTQTVIAPEDPWGKNFDATMVWGPVHGRKFYVGLRWNLPRI